MNNEIQIFNSDEFGEIRTVVIDSEPWFVGKDVALALGYGEGKSLANAVANHVEEEDRGVTEMMTPGGKQRMVIINESGVYSLVFGSKLPRAKEFKRWVTSEVLPTIRRTGGYVNDDELFVEIYLPNMAEEVKNLFRSNLLVMRQQTQIINEQGERIGELEGKVEQQRQTIEDYQPKVDYLDTILACPDAVTTTQIAADYDITAHKLNKILHEEGLQRKVGDQWILYRRHMGKGYTKSETYYIPHNDGRRPTVAMTTKWTQKGRLAIYEIMQSRGIVPKMDLAE